MGDYVFPVVILPLFFALLLLTRVVYTLFHELGHTIPALIFTKGPVIAFLGSYGDIKNSNKVAVNSRLSIYFKLNIFRWRGGMIVSENNGLPFHKNFVILFCGSMFPLLISIFALWGTYSLDLNGFIKLFTIVFFLSAIFGLRSLYPDDNPILMTNGGVGYNDGFQIRQNLRFKRLTITINAAYQLYDAGNDAGARNLLKQLKTELIDNSTLEIILTTYINLKDYHGGHNYLTMLSKIPKFVDINTNNFFLIGLIESKLNCHQKAMEYYNKSIILSEYNEYSLSNRGFTYNLLEDYEAAIDDFNRVLTINPSSAYALANRGYSKLKLSFTADGLKDIIQAIEIDENCGYAYRNLALYYREKCNFEMALTNFEKADSIDPDIYMLKEDLKATRLKTKPINS